jgi:hypothetical protein
MSGPERAPVAEEADVLEAGILTANPEQLATLAGWLGRMTALVQLRIAGLGREAARKDLVEEDELLDVEDVAKIFKQKPGWIYAHQGELPFRVNTPGGVIKFSKKGLQSYIRRRQVGS